MSETPDYDRKRAIGVILAYVQEERSAKTRCNDLNARAVVALLEDYARLTASPEGTDQ